MIATLATNKKFLNKIWYDEAIVDVQQWKLHTILVFINIVAMGPTNIMVIQLHKPWIMRWTYHH
jgi:hypothetical protein